MRMSLSGRLLEQFLLDLRTNLQKMGLKSKFKLIRRHLQLYGFDNHHERYLLSVHESLCGVWQISPGWEEVAHLIRSEYASWAVIFLQKPNEKNDPLGFLITSNDFMKMISESRINRLGRIRIHERDLSSKDKFNDWKSFFRLLNRTHSKDNSNGCYKLANS